MITLRLFGHETDANHIREEGRHCHLDRRGRLCDWRNDLRPLTMRRLLEPWTPQDDERLKGVRDSRCIGRQSRSGPQTQNRQRPSSRPCARLSLPTAAGGPTEFGPIHRITFDAENEAPPPRGGAPERYSESGPAIVRTHPRTLPRPCVCPRG